MQPMGVSGAGSLGAEGRPVEPQSREARLAGADNAEECGFCPLNQARFESAAAL